MAADLRRLYREMVAIRATEETIARAHRDGSLPGLLHLSIGGEATAVGVVDQLLPDDRVYSSHRAHGHFLAAGTDPRALLAELAGRETGLCRGRGGSMHLADEGAVMATGVVGGTLPIAVGHALCLPDGALAAVFFGDGSAQTGVFHEALNLAALWSARVLFVWENNGWAEFTSREEHTRVEAVVDYARLQGIAGETVDGSDVAAVTEAAGRLMASIRSGEGPALLECQVTRIRPHYEGDLRGPDAEGRDPVARLEERLVADGADPADLEQAQADALAAAESALAAALDDPEPRPEDDLELVFARQPGA